MEKMGEARGENARLAGAGPRQHQHRAVGRQNGLALFGVQALEIGRLAGDRQPGLGKRVIEGMGHRFRL